MAVGDGLPEKAWQVDPDSKKAPCGAFFFAMDVGYQARTVTTLTV
jgi:hypothetical protein